MDSKVFLLLDISLNSKTQNMKKLLTSAAFVFALISLSIGQNLELKLNAGSNLTFFSAFENRIVIIDQGLAVQGLIATTNSDGSLLIASDESSNTVQPGFSGSVELSNNLGKKWVHSVALGVSLWRYSYDNTVGRGDLEPYYQQTISEERYNALEPVTLSEVSGSWGEVQTLYFEVQPLNISRRLFGERLILQAGPLVSFLLKNDYSDYAITYNEGAEHTWEEIDNVYFTSVGNFEDVIYGVKLRAGFALYKQLRAYISGKYFSDVYADGPNPFQLQAGISYSLWKFGPGN